MIESKLTSSLEKAFFDMSVADFPTLSSISALKNERVSFQLLYRAVGETDPHRIWASLTVEGVPSELVTVRTVESIPSMLPCYPGHFDDNYLRTSPGLYPDLLLPLGNKARLPVVRGELRSAWITLELNGSIVGDLPLRIKLICGDALLCEHELALSVIDAELPEQTIKVTQWFHGDCLATYYNCDVLSERWWQIVESFMKTAVENGINTILTPIFTPPLDTAVGGERPTVQLVDVKKSESGYSFSYEKLDRWIELCDSVGVKFFEIAHLFTQWGAAHAPKIMATADGEYRRIFGWETDAAGPEYTAFLRAFLTDFIAHMKSRGDDTRCLFHISDEPNADNLEQYKRSRETVIDLLEGYTVMDALSNVEFYHQGLVTTPIPANNHIEPFLDAKIDGLWTYYCCGQSRNNVSNRFFAMPSWRTRSIGSQFFKYDIVGFLQWGYNFYYSQCSYSFVDPYLDSTGNYFAPSGDTYSVYPSQDGNAYESLRLVVFHEALQDLAAFTLAAKLVGKEKVIESLEKHLGSITFSNCARAAAPLLTARDYVNSLIQDNIGKDIKK